MDMARPAWMAWTARSFRSYALSCCEATIRSSSSSSSARTNVPGETRAQWEERATRTLVDPRSRAFLPGSSLTEHESDRCWGRVVGSIAQSSTW